MSKLSVLGGAFTAICISIAAPIMTPLPAQASPAVVGTWTGASEGDMGLTTVILSVTRSANGFEATFESTSEGSTRILVADVVFQGRDVLFDLPIHDDGYLVTPSEDGTLIAGLWTQGGTSRPLILTRAGVPDLSAATATSGG